VQIDVEGDEHDVLLGLTHWDIISQIVAEVHDLDGRPQAIMDLLQSRGFLVVIDAGSAPNTAIVYATREQRLLSACCAD
jgi:hypothetical protein